MLKVNVEYPKNLHDLHIIVRSLYAICMIKKAMLFI